MPEIKISMKLIMKHSLKKFSKEKNLWILVPIIYWLDFPSTFHFLCSES